MIIKIIFFSLLFLLTQYSCGYPDIDSVPDFKNITITHDESIDLCKLNNTDKKNIFDCIKKIDIQE